MDGQYCGDVPHPAGQTGQGLQVHCDVCRDAEEWRRTPCGQLVLLGHHHRRKLHSKMGEPYYELCGQCLRCGSSIGRGHDMLTHAHTYHTQQTTQRQCNAFPQPAGGPQVPHNLQ